MYVVCFYLQWFWESINIFFILRTVFVNQTKLFYDCYRKHSYFTIF